MIILGNLINDTLWFLFSGQLGSWVSPHELSLVAWQLRSELLLICCGWDRNTIWQWAVPHSYLLLPNYRLRHVASLSLWEARRSTTSSPFSCIAGEMGINLGLCWSISSFKTWQKRAKGMCLHIFLFVMLLSSLEPGRSRCTICRWARDRALELHPHPLCLVDTSETVQLPKTWMTS